MEVERPQTTSRFERWSDAHTTTAATGSGHVNDPLSLVIHYGTITLQKDGDSAVAEQPRLPMNGYSSCGGS